MIVQSSKSLTEGFGNVPFKLKASAEKRGGEKFVPASQQQNMRHQSDAITKEANTWRIPKTDLEYTHYCTGTT